MESSTKHGSKLPVVVCVQPWAGRDNHLTGILKGKLKQEAVGYFDEL